MISSSSRHCSKSRLFHHHAFRSALSVVADWLLQVAALSWWLFSGSAFFGRWLFNSGSMLFRLAECAVHSGPPERRPDTQKGRATDTLKAALNAAPNAAHRTDVPDASGAPGAMGTTCTMETTSMQSARTRTANGTDTKNPAADNLKRDLLNQTGFTGKRSEELVPRRGLEPPHHCWR